MIRVLTTPDSITIAGHAGYAEKGKDIVCSAVSALVFTLQKAMEELTDDKPDFIFLEDEVIIEYPNISEQGMLLINSLLLGLNLIADEYPYNIEVQA